MVFWSELTEQDEGLYTCRASFYHHAASVSIQVEVSSEDQQLGENSDQHADICFQFQCGFLGLSVNICGFNHSVPALMSMICMSSAFAIFLIFVVVLWACW